MKVIQWLIMGIIVLILILLVSSLFLEEPHPKVTQYKPKSTVSTVKQEDDDDCTYTTCHAFGGGIAGDTLAIQFMNGE